MSVDGYGILRHNPKASFAIDVRTDRRAKAFTGTIAFADGAAKLVFRSTRIATVTTTGHTATITGSGLANRAPVTFVVTAVDGSPDRFSITLSKGYSATDSLKKGKIRIRDRCEHHRRRH